MTAVFYLLRHAHHDQLGRILTGRTVDVALSSRGQEQVRALAEPLSRHRLQAIYTSPQLRAVQTAETLGRACGLTPERAEALDEIDFGSWSGREFSQLDDDAEWLRWNANRDTASTPSGETMRQVAGRMVRFIDDARRRLPEGRVVLVSHCDVIKAVVCHYLTLPFQQLHRFEIAPASVTSLAVGDWGGKLLSVNERHPVPAEG